MKETINKILRTFAICVIFMIATIGVLMGMAIQGHAEDLNPYREILASASEADIQAIEQTVYWESAVADCPFETNCGVVETILNRKLSGEWGETIYDICHAKGQFVCKPIPKNASEYVRENISDAIEYEWHSASSAKFLPINSVYFATKKQSYGKEHVWLGEVKADGKPRKGKGMYFCIPK